ncbi:MAG: dimethyl sulfoxide reductase anchor subunit, partial [Candidatus Omnitrophica bacterium]|nr:dimethyl sulfoxide reductase anchor subunit [Candidatus Omnitrophota bacterium]
FEPGQKKYRELLPPNKPGQNQQYAFEVDLDKCTGCKACVTACHSENGLDEDETWRSVGLIQGGTSDNPALQHITTACHHCVEPGCMNGCPTKAYIKDEDTGIVKHLDDQCFGCQYCILKCPYDVPKYNKKRGIVHKCDMCIGRLTNGQAPACARACPTGAIRIVVVDKEEAKTSPQRFVNVPDAPASDYTFPTTKYKTSRTFPQNMESADYYTLQPEHSHFPLVVMLTLTQLSVGAFFAEFMFKTLTGPQSGGTLNFFHTAFALGIGLVALAASIFHLGRPHLAYRAFLGFMTSWLSREIIAFGAFAKLAILCAISYLWKPIMAFTPFLETAVIISGLLGIFCSVMVYKDTRRPFWDNYGTTIKFFFTALVLGFSAMNLTSITFALFSTHIQMEYLLANISVPFFKVVMAGTIIKLLFESSVFIHLTKGDLNIFKKTALLMTGALRRFTAVRFICGVIGGVLLPLLICQMYTQLTSGTILFFVLLSFLCLLTGEFLERYLFFRAVVPLKMPGGR